MMTQQHDARQQLEQFLSALFLPDELIEIRFIESWVSRDKRKSRVVCPARWLRRHEFVSQHGEITELAQHERANVYFGVCPRPKNGDAQDDRVKTIRCIWCDIDHVTANEACERWIDAGVPVPSIVVRSGSGSHGYWLLDCDLQTSEERSQFAVLLPHFYRSFGGDHVQNLSRVLRPPGTMNLKDVRNGRPSLACTLYECDSQRTYPLEAFFPWIELSEEKPQRRIVTRSCRSATEPTATEVLSEYCEAASIVRHLDKPCRDRSRRDFAVVCDLLRLGLCNEEIWSLVCGSSKFESNGRSYFDLTTANAERRVFLDEASTGQLRAPT